MIASAGFKLRLDSLNGYLNPHCRSFLFGERERRVGLKEKRSVGENIDDDILSRTEQGTSGENSAWINAGEGEREIARQRSGKEDEGDWTEVYLLTPFMVYKHTTRHRRVTQKDPFPNKLASNHTVSLTP